GSTYLPPDETDSEDDDSSHNKAADAAAATAAASGGSAAASSDPPGQQQQSNADSASSLGSTTNEQQHHASSDDNNASAPVAAAAAAAAAAGDSQKHRVGAAGKLWAQQEQEPESSTSSPPPPPPSDTSVQMVEPAWGSGGDPQAPRPYWPTEEEAAGVASGEGDAVVALGGKEGGREANGKSGEPAGAEGRSKLGLGGMRRAEAAWKLTSSETQSQQPGHPQEQAAAAGVPDPPPVRPGLPPPRGSSSALQATSVSESAQAPLRRKTSMGSFQKGMGESLTGRLRKQLDIPDAPKREIDINIPVKQIQSLKYLAQGAMCVAYTALLNGQKVVLKTPLPDTSHAAVAANDLEVEMLLLKELHHDNIVSLLGAGFLPDGRRFVALEYLSGGTLSSLLREHREKPMGISKVLDLSLALCNALEYLHDVAVPGRIVCHRDLKPDNIGFAQDGTLKLIDFGLGKIIKRKFRVRAEKYHMTGGTGSLRYMAPEIADHQEYNEKGDVYSFSLIMWEMLTGTKPFLGLKRPDFYNRVVDEGERPPLNPEWPQPVRHLLESCWRTNLDERLSFREVAGILKVCAEEENRRSFTEEKRKSFRLPNRRSRLWTTTGARPDLDEISVDPQYKPKFKISSFLSSHQSTGGRKSKMEKLRNVARGNKGKQGSVRRASSDNTVKDMRRTTSKP
ncbi:unnamed protein product, partial [Ectocarpus sp. 12 AP-2014]